MDLASVIGLISGIFFILMSIFIGAKYDMGLFAQFYDSPSVMITIGGTVAATFISFPLSKIIAALKAVKKVFSPPKTDPANAIENIIKLANLARKEGILALEDSARNMDDVFLQKGIMLIVDGTDPELTRNIMETELTFIDGRHRDIRGVWEFIGGSAPAWGMIGTLIGLVLMLQDMSDPDSLGPSMAVALITTFYGTIIANFIANPFANKLKVFSGDELLVKEVLIEGMLSIQAGENPRIIEEKLKSFLAPALRNHLGNGTINKQAGE